MLNLWAYLGTDISVRHPRLGNISCSGLDEDYQVCQKDAQLTRRFSRCEEIKQTGRSASHSQGVLCPVAIRVFDVFRPQDSRKSCFEQSRPCHLRNQFMQEHDSVLLDLRRSNLLESMFEIDLRSTNGASRSAQTSVYTQMQQNANKRPN